MPLNRNSFSFKLFGRLAYLWRGKIGNYYTNKYKDSWDVVKQTAGELANLEDKTIDFVRSFCEADIPVTLKEAALFNMSTLRTQTCFRTPDGNFYGWESIHDTAGSCMGSCTHVWNYEQTTASLYGDLAKSMREVEFKHATNSSGHMNFRVNLPLWLNRIVRGPAAADSQMGTIMKMYRGWQLSGDDEFLERHWPKVRKAFEFAWLPHRSASRTVYGPCLWSWLSCKTRKCSDDSEEHNEI